MKIKWPNGKKFAFTIFDDTDQSILRNTKPVYDFLGDLGIKTTKSVWVNSVESKLIQSVNDFGSTCEDHDYLNWLLQLQKEGFEIALHNARSIDSQRPITEKALTQFSSIFGKNPDIFVNHNSNKENIYWGIDRLSGYHRYLYAFMKMYSNLGKNKLELSYKGHKPNSEYFWGDICKKNIKYVRNFVYDDINTLKACPYMPYHDPTKNFVNYWFASSNGGNLADYNNLLRIENQEKLEDEGGLCIVYTHFAKGFYHKNRLNDEFKYLMENLAKKDGWFVPVTDVLDYLLTFKEDSKNIILKKDKMTLERNWLNEKFKIGSK